MPAAFKKKAAEMKAKSAGKKEESDKDSEMPDFIKKKMSEDHGELPEAFKKNIGKLMHKGVPVEPLLKSNVFDYRFDYE